MHRKFGVNLIGMAAAVALLAACGSNGDETAATAGTGAAGGAPVVNATPGEVAVAPEPSGVTPGTQEDLVANVGDRVFFDYDSYDLTPNARDTLQRQAQWLQTYPNLTVTVEGHADERGTREYNLALGERRANTVKDYLVTLGVAPNRVSTISYGEERPVALCSDESCWAQNRRAVTIVN